MLRFISLFRTGYYHFSPHTQDVALVTVLILKTVGKCHCSIADGLLLCAWLVNARAN